MVGGGGGVVSRSRCVVGSGIVVSLPLVGDLGGVTVVVVSMVGHVLGPSVREGHRVGTLHVTWCGVREESQMVPEPSEVSPAL